MVHTWRNPIYVLGLPFNADTGYSEFNALSLFTFGIPSCWASLDPAAATGLPPSLGQVSLALLQLLVWLGLEAKVLMFKNSSDFFPSIL